MTENRQRKIVYMGTPDFAVPALKALVREGYRVTAVVTQPDKPKGRGKTLLPSPVKETALEYGIPVLQPRRVREEGFLEILQQYEPDLIVVAAFGQIIPVSVLELPEFGCINIHASLLPKYRGAAPIQHAILDGEKETGVTIMQMGEGLDTGDILTKKAIPIRETDTAGSLFDTLAEEGAELLIRTLPSVFEGTAVREKQPEESPTAYASMIRKEHGLLDFGRSAEELERHIRGMDPWPGAFTHLDGKTLKVWKAAALSSAGKEADGSVKEPGTILSADKDGILIACKEGSLLLTEIQLEGKKRMDSGAFLRGYHLETGTKLS